MNGSIMNLFACFRPRFLINAALILIILAGIVFQANAEGGKQKKCLIVASYHDGFPGQYLKVKGARSVLEGKCEIKQFDMDTKRNPSPAFCRKKALEAKALIESWKPDIVIAIDDNASKYFVQPYLKDASLPVVFSGIDWTAEEYGYPYSNATGIIEVFPIKHLIKQITRILPDAKNAVFIRGDRLSAEKNYKRFKQICKTHDIDVIDNPVSTFDEFKNAYRTAQESDFIIFHNYAGIKGWDNTRAKRFIFEHSAKLGVSLLEWMTGFTMLAITLVIEEQGEYAAEVALRILDGAKPADFPIVANRKWNIFLNEPLLEKVGIKIPRDLLRKAEKVN